jgi:ABC-type antimicrobial peptide transport system permease subunit
MAIGAGPATVVLQILKQAGVLVAVGLAIGGPLSVFLVRYTSAIVKGGSAHAAGTISLVAVFLLCIAAGAAFLPAVRATRMDPVKALKHE